MWNLLLELDLLGPPRVARGDEFALPTRKALALLACLALGGPLPRGRLAAMLWSDRSEDEARRNLRQELHRLQSTPAGDWIVASTSEVALRPGIRVDVVRFHAAAAADDFEQSLALSNVAAMLRPGGILLSNNALYELPATPMRSVGYTTVVYSSKADDGDHIVWYQRQN